MGKKFGLSFSWKRAVGISSAKAKFARATGIPTTRQGRQRKAGAAMGCMISIVCIIGLFVFCSCGKKQDPNFGLMQQKILESRLTYKDKTSNYSDKIQETEEKISEIKEKFKDDPEALKSLVEACQGLLKTYQILEEINKKISNESPEQMKKAAFLMVHIQYAALKDSAAKKEFLKMTNDKELFSATGTGVQSIFIMKYPVCAKESETKEYIERVNLLVKDLNLKFSGGVLIYDKISDLEHAYDIVKKFY